MQWANGSGWDEDPGYVLDEIQHHIIIPPLSTNDANGVDGVFPSFLCGVPSFPRFQPAVPR